jgi:hypothetical protein
MYAGQHGGKKIRVNKNCMKKKSYYWMSNKPSPLQSRDLN